MNNYNCELINIDENFDEAVERAVELYLRSDIFVYPTDTIYGFGGNPFKSEVINRIADLKGRDSGKKFILLINDLKLIGEFIEVSSERHFDSLHHIWPGPVSVILNLNEHAANALKMKAAAFRIPEHRFCSRLLSKLKMPLISTSVNRNGREPLNDKNLIRYEFGNSVEAIFYSSLNAANTASTLIDLTTNNPLLIREGSVKFADLLKYF